MEHVQVFSRVKRWQVTLLEQRPVLSEADTAIFTKSKQELEWQVTPLGEQRG